MNARNRSLDPPERHESVRESTVNELTSSLSAAHRQLADLKALVAAANAQTEAARSQYTQTAERMEALRRRLDSNVAELKASRESIETRDRKISSLENSMKLRDERIAKLEGANFSTDTLGASRSLPILREQVAKMGLVLESLENPGLKYKISRATTTIGRSSVNDFSINSDTLSRYHARITVEAEGVYLNDLYSRNGCTVNGKRVMRRRLTDGDAVMIGMSKFRFSVGGDSSELEDRSMDETFPILEEEVSYTFVPNSARRLD